MASALLTRRSMLQTAAVVTTALAAPFVRGTHAAGNSDAVSGTIGYQAQRAAGKTVP
jgi:hypothetical protein